MTSKKKIELVIFDCDGVLVDSETISARILIALLGEVGLDVDLAYVQRNFLGRSWPKVAAEIRTQCGLTLDAGFEERYREKLLTAFETELRPMEGVATVVEELAVKMCVATSSSPNRVRKSVELSALNGFFHDNLYTASQVKNGKPAPDLFQFAARSMGVPVDECLVIEDSIPGILAARAAQMQVWRFTGGSYLRGATQDMPVELADVKTFDNWAQFFDMAPELKRQQARLPETNE